MRVSVDLPDPKTSSGLDAAVAKQFADIQRQLMQLVESKDASAKTMQTALLEAMSDQQEALVQALERLMEVVGKTSQSAPSDALVGALRGMKQTLAALPQELQATLERRMTSSTPSPSKAVSSVSLQMPKGFLNRLDQLESTLVNGLRRSRNRTFGSNF